MEHLIINILLIFLPLVFLPYLLKVKQKKKLLYQTLLTCSFLVALISAMSFPVNINGQIFDFRIIPLILGSLYGGIQISAMMYATLLLLRYIFSNPNPLEYALSLTPTILLFILFLRKYESFGLLKKVVITIAASSFVRMYTLASYSLLTHNINNLTRASTLLTSLFQCVITGLFVLVIEYILKNFYIQNEIIKSEKMKVVSEMAASVAHEIRNPLTAIRGFIELLGISHLSGEKREFYKSICLEELDRAQQIISDYLSMAKDDPDKIERILINDEITYISNLLRSYANYQNVQIQISNLDEKYAAILGDKNKFRQAILNLGKNAIEAMPSGGMLKIEAVSSNHDVEIRISDTGIGMSEQQISRLGIPYYSTKDKGTGLGTMVSFNIIKKMQGKIGIDSVKGEGTSVKITFPLSDKPI